MKKSLLIIVLLPIALTGQETITTTTISFGDTNGSALTMPLSSLALTEPHDIFQKDRVWHYRATFIGSDGSIEQSKEMLLTILEEEDDRGLHKVKYEIKDEDKSRRITAFSNVIENENMIGINLPHEGDFDILSLMRQISYNYEWQIMTEIERKHGFENISLPEKTSFAVPLSNKTRYPKIDSIYIEKYYQYKKSKCDLGAEIGQLTCYQNKQISKTDFGTIETVYLVDPKKYGFLQFHIYLPKEEEIVLKLEKTNF